MLGIILLTIFFAISINIVLKKFQLPTIVGYIATGTIISHLFGLHSVAHDEALKHTAEFGVVFLMFTIGLEFSVTHLLRMRHEVFVTGTLQVVLTTLISYGILHYLFDLKMQSALIIGSALALSSTAIVLKLYNESGQISKRHGQRVLGILILQDIAVIPILLMIGFFSIEGQSLSTVLIETAVGAVLLILLLWIIGRYVLEWFFDMIIKTDSDELFVGSVLLIAIGASYLAYLFGFSYSLGAFIAGVLIAETHFKHQVEADLIPFRDLLLGLFFITVGMQINFGVISAHLLEVVGALVAVMVMKMLITYIIVKRNDSKRIAMKTALSLMQVGEFSLVVLEVASSHGLVQELHAQILIVTVIISMLITPLILRNLPRITGKLVKLDPTENIPTDFHVRDLESHVVVLGYGHFGQELVRDLKRQHRTYVIVEYNIELFKKGKNQGEPIIFGNAVKRHILESVQIDQAKAVIVAIDNPHKLQMVCEAIRQTSSQQNIIVRVPEERAHKELEHLGIEHVVIESQEMARVIVERVAAL